MTVLQRFLDRLVRRTNRLQGKGWGNNTFESEVRQILKQLPTPEVVVDVGGNIGDWTASILQNSSPKAVYIFEPSSANHSRLRDRFASQKTVHLIPAALSTSDGTASLFADEAGSGLASLYQRSLSHIGIDHHMVEEISTICFASFLQRFQVGKVDVLKLDIEGHEYSALCSIDKAFRNRIELIQFEFGGCNIDSRTYFRDFWNLLSNQFALFRMTPLGLVEVSRYRESDECFLTSNYLCVNRSRR